MKHKPLQILHITSNLGTGVGVVVLNYLAKTKGDNRYKHTVTCLDYANENSLKAAKEHGFKILGDMSKKKAELLTMVKHADIVLVHWWNHPLLYDFLVREKLPPCRLIFWSHVSGLLAPNVFNKKVLEYPNKFIFATPISSSSTEIRSLEKAGKKFNTIWSTGGLDRIKSVKLKKHKGFNIGYLGTVDHVKMHPSFLSMVKAIKIPQVKFIVIGGPNHRIMEEEARRLGIADKIVFTGFIPEEQKWELVKEFDIFGYPLSKDHYGASDQALQEAMGIGLPPVVFDNKMERHMVQNGKTGIIVKTPKQYVQAVEKLYRNKRLRNKLSKNVRAYAQKEYSPKKMALEWDKVFKELMREPKKERVWQKPLVKKIAPSDIFLESIGGYAKAFKSKEEIVRLGKLPHWRSKSKGTVHQYKTFLPNDSRLNKWSKLM